MLWDEADLGLTQSSRLNILGSAGSSTVEEVVADERKQRAVACSTTTMKRQLMVRELHGEWWMDDEMKLEAGDGGVREGSRALAKWGLSVVKVRVDRTPRTEYYRFDLVLLRARSPGRLELDSPQFTM